jgi:hypothetical protein
MKKGAIDFILKLVGALMLVASTFFLNIVFGIISIVLLLVGTVLLTSD